MYFWENYIINKVAKLGMGWVKLGRVRAAGPRVRSAAVVLWPIKLKLYRCVGHRNVLDRPPPTPGQRA